jgi:hypothetical protein
MPGEFRTYADTVAAVTGDAASPTLVELVAAADAVDTALSLGQDLTAPLARWQSAASRTAASSARPGKPAALATLLGHLSCSRLDDPPSGH